MTKRRFTGVHLRKWFRIIHRDLSFFFSGVIIIYAVSGIMLNHRGDINPNYTIKRHSLQAEGTFPITEENVSKSMVITMLKPIKEEKNYTKHYFPENGKLKVFLKGGSSLEVNLQNGGAIYEALKKRPIISQFNRLHYNPGKGWTVFSDIFAVSLIIITITGIFINKGKKGILGRGGIELLAGIIVPILFMLLV
ncbi:MAG: PepSY-associated TM helix domain-containing protein [Bacteroidales bacterium]|jgi:hypothetical protein|nr:PepSY-associated TM helix domain-containing protein [Bacteroidales bacterium]HOH71625.1 PepSY-associated TM helix domain-containing protein [Paludibacteraceae bacterium]MBP8981819.1 PepSY-associated TM helix domain-containing protein [Bacteroidales bacterium]HOD25947.1 PepSY-associated TM helix domain-containing protein [Bacteroidales bacterium]HPN46755.1 PepSY-associated TM helix domain-containing protein [Bacteroidales bacterium]